MPDLLEADTKRSEREKNDKDLVKKNQKNSKYEYIFEYFLTAKTFPIYLYIINTHDIPTVIHILLEILFLVKKQGITDEGIVQT